MILSNDCWMKESCFRYKCIENCECKNNSIYCPKLFKLDQLFEQALIPINLRKNIDLRLDKSGTDLKAFEELKKIENSIIDFINKGKNLYIHSNICGNGKTAWSLRLIQTYFLSIWHKSNIECNALFINVPRYLLALKDSINNENEYANHIKENLYSANLIVWDDIATKNITSFEAENLLSILDTRFNMSKSNIFTSNLSEKELYDSLGSRLASRIIGYSQSIELRGSDKRGLNNI